MIIFPKDSAKILLTILSLSLGVLRKPMERENLGIKALLYQSGRQKRPADIFKSKQNFRRGRFIQRGIYY